MKVEDPCIKCLVRPVCSTLCLILDDYLEYMINEKELDLYPRHDSWFELDDNKSFNISHFTNRKTIGFMSNKGMINYNLKNFPVNLKKTCLDYMRKNWSFYLMSESGSILAVPETVQ